MKIVSLLCLCSYLPILTVIDLRPFSHDVLGASRAAPHTVAKPTNLISALPRNNPNMEQSLYRTPVHFDAFQTINLTDDSRIEFGISVQELNLHLVNPRTSDRLI